MKITLVAALSLNGHLTNGQHANEAEWTSDEDKEHFLGMLEQAQAIIMGARTYEVHPGTDEPSYPPLRVILTSEPEKYLGKERSGAREFWNKSADETAQELQKRGFESVLLVGGAYTNKLFLDAGLVDELVVTIEPKLFGKGRPLLDETELSVQLTLIDQNQLNDRGSMLLHYRLEK